MFEALLPLTDYLIATQAVHPRALAPDEVEAIARGQAYTGAVEQIPDVRVALQRASELVGQEGLVCTTGSLFIVGEVRTICGLPAGHVVRGQPVLRVAHNRRNGR